MLTIFKESNRKFYRNESTKNELIKNNFFLLINQIECIDRRDIFNLENKEEILLKIIIS